MEALNWPAILVFVIGSFALGYLWYGPLFGNAWLNALGWSKEDVKPSAGPYLVAFFASLLMGIAMAWVIGAIGVTDWMDGLGVGLLVGVGFIASSSVSDGEFCKSSRNLRMIHAFYRIGLAALGGILFAVC
ncbi:MAG: DUF1761 domain-containing protein [Pseudomonadales bacterium]|nr:DUF1761 domain-containing protein [Pseudomonadales bacterium]